MNVYKAHGLRSMGYLFLMDEKKKEKAPPSAVDGLLGIEKRVGSWGKRKKKVWGEHQRIDTRRSIRKVGINSDKGQRRRGFENLLTLGVRVVHFAKLA